MSRLTWRRSSAGSRTGSRWSWPPGSAPVGGRSSLRKMFVTYFSTALGLTLSASTTRGLLAELAARGKTVFVSSHLMSEIAQTATHLIVIGRGRLIADTSVAEFIAAAAPPAVRVRSSDSRALAALLRSPGVTVAPADDGALAVSGMPAAQIGAAAAAAGITVLELATEQTSLEDAFVDM